MDRLPAPFLHQKQIKLDSRADKPLQIRREVSFVERLDFIQVIPEGLPDASGQTKQFHDAQSCPIKKLSHQQRCSFHKGKCLPYFIDRQYDGQHGPRFARTVLFKSPISMFKTLLNRNKRALKAWFWVEAETFNKRISYNLIL